MRWLTMLAVGTAMLVAIAGCGGGSTSTVTQTVTTTVEKKTESANALSPDQEFRFEAATEYEERAEQRLIEAETARRNGEDAKSLSLSAAGERLLSQANEIIAEAEQVTAEE